MAANVATTGRGRSGRPAVMLLLQGSIGRWYMSLRIGGAAIQRNARVVIVTRKVFCWDGRHLYFRMEKE